MAKVSMDKKVSVMTPKTSVVQPKGQRNMSVGQSISPTQSLMLQQADPAMSLSLTHLPEALAKAARAEEKAKAGKRGGKRSQRSSIDSVGPDGLDMCKLSELKLERAHRLSDTLDSLYMCFPEMSMPALPTAYVPLSKSRRVLMKIGDEYLRVSSSGRPTLSAVKPPLLACIPFEDEEWLSLPRELFRARRDPAKFDYDKFTFFLDEGTTMMESWYRNNKTFFTVRIAVVRSWLKDTFDCEYLGIISGAADTYTLSYVSTQCVSGTWWYIYSVGINKYVVESVNYPGICMEKGKHALTLSTTPLTRQDRISICKGQWDSDRTMTIVSVPDIAVRPPAVFVL